MTEILFTARRLKDFEPITGTYYCVGEYKRSIEFEKMEAGGSCRIVKKHYIHVYDEMTSYEIDIATIKYIINGKKYTVKELQGIMKND